jgi:hypothetical protein
MFGYFEWTFSYYYIHYQSLILNVVIFWNALVHPTAGQPSIFHLACSGFVSVTRCCPHNDVEPSAHASDDDDDDEKTM